MHILFFRYLEMKQVPLLSCAKEVFFLSLFFGSVQQQQQQQKVLLKVADVYYHFWVPSPKEWGSIFKFQESSLTLRRKMGLSGWKFWSEFWLLEYMEHGWEFYQKYKTIGIRELLCIHKLEILLSFFFGFFSGFLGLFLVIFLVWFTEGNLRVVVRFCI